jgi:hypothetical protein
VLGTVAWTAVSDSVRSQLAKAAAAAAKSGHAIHAAAGAKVPAAVTDHALAYGFSRGFLVSAGIALLALIVTITMIRVTREDLAGVQNPMVG